MNEEEDAAAMWGLAENGHNTVSARLHCALKALTYFGAPYIETEEPEVVVSWCDDGVTLMCKRDACLDEDGHWWQEVQDDLTLPGLRRAMDAHKKEKHS